MAVNKKRKKNYFDKGVLSAISKLISSTFSISQILEIFENNNIDTRTENTERLVYTALKNHPKTSLPSQLISCFLDQNFFTSKKEFDIFCKKLNDILVKNHVHIFEATTVDGDKYLDIDYFEKNVTKNASATGAEPKIYKITFVRSGNRKDTKTEFVFLNDNIKNKIKIGSKITRRLEEFAEKSRIGYARETMDYINSNSRNSIYAQSSFPIQKILRKEHNKDENKNFLLLENGVTVDVIMRNMYEKLLKSA